MLFAPVANLAPERLSVAVPDPVRVVIPNEVLPTRKVTVPLGATLPLAGMTVAVNVVLPAAAMLAGAAVMAVLVAAGTAVTVKVVEAVEALKLPVGT